MRHYIRHPIASEYDKRFVPLWKESYEFSLDNYARLTLACKIDQHIPAFALADLTSGDSPAMRFELNHCGHLMRIKPEPPNTDESLDPNIKIALGKAAEHFGPLPTGSADVMDFLLMVEQSAVTVKPLLFEQEPEIARSLLQSLPQHLDPSKAHLVRVGTKTGLIQSISEDGTRGSAAQFDVHAHYPASFPHEISFGIRPSKGNHLVCYSRLAIATPNPDEWDSRRAVRAGQAVRPELMRTEQALSADKTSIILLTRAAELTRKCYGLERSLEYCGRIIKAYPQQHEGYSLRATLMRHHASAGLVSFDDVGADIIESCHAALDRVGRTANRQNILIILCETLARVGPFDEFAKWSRKLKPTFHSHRLRAQFFESIEAWPQAVSEWQTALDCCEPDNEPRRQEGLIALTYCRDQLQCERDKYGQFADQL